MPRLLSEEQLQQAVLRGGLYALATPRGFGKSSLCECACVWAVLYGHRDFVCLIGSDEGHAMDMLDAIKMELDGNDLLLEDFPEVVYPIHALDGIANRCSGQLYQGKRTHVGWTAREVVLKTAEGREYRAADAETLTEEVLGFRLPLAGLADWVRGRPSDPQTARIEYDKEGRVHTLQERGWAIEYLEYEDKLPKRMRLTYPNIELRLAISQWK